MNARQKFRRLRAQTGRGWLSNHQPQVAEIDREITSADRHAIKILLTVPQHSDVFHSVLQTASLSAIHEAYLVLDTPDTKSGSRRAAIGERQIELMSLAVPHPES